MLIFKGLKFIGKKKFQFLVLSSFKVNRNTVWIWKIYWGLKMHCQNIVDGRCLQKEFKKNIFAK